MHFDARNPRRRAALLAVGAALVAGGTVAAEARRELEPNVPGLVRRAEDRGRINDDIPIERAILTLAPRPGADEDLRRFLDAQQAPGLPEYHRWLTPEQFGERFGSSSEDSRRVASWLAAEGFRVESIALGRRWIVFSGTAGMFGRSFGAPFHEFHWKGSRRIAAIATPTLPADLAGLVRGIVSLNDLPRHSSIVAVRRLPGRTMPENNSGGEHFLAPADFSTIYNLGPLSAASVDGRGHSVAVVGRTDIELPDVAYFRSFFGLPASVPKIIHAGPAPGVTSDEIESDLDVEWAGAAAPGATIKLVTAASTLATDGVDLAAAWAVDHVAALVLSSSYGSCEEDLGAAGLDFYNSLWAQAAAEGISVFVASGDTGAAGCDDPTDTAGTSAAVNGLCSTPYDTCVGGTEFDDSGNPALYWSEDDDPSTQGSARGYIPEVVWNETDSSGLSASGGGASSFFSKPSWQVVDSVPADGVRNVPDVSLSAAAHTAYLVIQGHSVASAGVNEVFGTSASAPAFAGLMARVVQKTGGGQGNPNFALYRIADDQFSHGGENVFHDITSGNNGVPGVAGFSAGQGFDLATGWGSVDGDALVRNWPAVSSADFSLSPASPIVYATAGGVGSVTVTVARSGGFAGYIVLSAAGLPAGVRADFSPSSVSSLAPPTLTIHVDGSVPRGPYGIRLEGAAGAETHSVPLTIRVMSPVPAGLTSMAMTTPGSSPAGIAAGPDGALWVAESGLDRIARVGTDGSMTEFSVPTSGSLVNEITAGPDGALWFTEFQAGRIGRITTSGVVTEFALPDPTSAPYGIVTGPDGALWITLLSSGRIARLTPSGAEIEFDIPTPASEPNYLAVGPDGNIWFTEFSANQIARITLSGEVTEFPIPTPESFPQGIAAGSGGDLWFAEAEGKIGRIDLAGAVDEFAIPTASSNPNSIVFGPDGSMWFTEQDGNQIGRIGPDGSVTEFGAALASLGPYDAAVGPDGAIWFTDLAAGAVSRLPVASSALAVVQWQSATVAIPENAGPLRLTALRTGSTQTSVSVGYKTLGVTATSGKDYKGVSGTLTFAPGETQQTVSVTLINDTKPEPSKTFKLVLSNPGGGAALGSPSTAIVTILDDDSSAAGSIAWSKSAATVGENAGSVTLTASRTGGSTGAVSVAYRTKGASALSGRDYNGVSGTLAFADGEISRTVTIKIINNATPNPTRTFSVVLSAPTGGASLGSPTTEAVTIEDDDSGAPVLTEFDVPTAAANPNGIALGPDGALWFAEYDSDIVGRITAAGVVSEFLLNPGTGPSFLTAGPDGNVWFTEFDSDAIGRITPAGTVTEFPLAAGAGPNGITWGPDGALWFTEYLADRIGRITTSGSVTEFDLASGAVPYEIVTGPDGNLWFTELDRGVVGSLTPAGHLEEFDVPAGADGLTSGIAAGPDGNLWFCEYGSGKVGRATTAGAITEFDLPVPGATPNEITAGPDGKLWFTDTLGNAVGQISTGGAALEYSMPDAASGPYDIAPGPDGALWLTEADADRIGTLALSTGSTIQLSFALAGVADTAGSLALVVTRTGAAEAAATVSYRTLGSTATSGVDYSGKSGTLTFAAGESVKSISIPILKRGGSHGPRTFSLILSAPAGAALGYPSSASITIVDGP